MKLKHLEPEDAGICNSFLVTEITSFQELVLLFNEYAEKYKGSSILLTIDDLAQAEYTSAHAKMSHDLDDTDGYDLSNVDPSAFEGGEHIGYLSTNSEFFIRKRNFENRSIEVSFLDACKRGLTIGDEELNLLERIHENPINFFDREILLKVVPVEKSYLAISAFPNGYFTCDLNPFENYSVAKHLYEKYGYELFGIGASLIGFKRKKSLNEKEAQSLMVDLANLYNQKENEPIVKKISNFAKMHNYLFLKYVESLE